MRYIARYEDRGGVVYSFGSYRWKWWAHVVGFICVEPGYEHEVVPEEPEVLKVEVPVTEEPNKIGVFGRKMKLK